MGKIFFKTSGDVDFSYFRMTANDKLCKLNNNSSRGDYIKLILDPISYNETANLVKDLVPIQNSS